MQLLDIPVIVVLWRLLRPVNETLALTATGLNLVQTAMLVANRVQLLAALDLLTTPALGDAFLPGQREALAMLAVGLHGQGFGIGLIFFGVACVIRGALVAASGLLPRVLGWGLVHLITELLKSDQFFFPVVIRARTFAWAAICVVVAGVGSALVVRRRIDRLDMVAALKTRE